METFPRFSVFLIIVFLQIIYSARGDINDIPKFADNFMTDKVRLLKPSAELVKNYPYYWSGFDEDERPIWVLELGKWDVRKMAESDSKVLAEFDTYVDNMIFHMIDSTRSNQTSTSVANVAVVIDMDQWPMRQIASHKNILYILGKFRHLTAVIHHFLGYCFLINMNYPTQTLVAMLRPILGSIMEKVELMGPQKVKWIPRLRSKFPENQIPEWYGGDKDFKPIGIYG